MQLKLFPERKYRFRYDGSTRGARDRFDKILPKLGQILYVKGYRYFGRYQTTHEAIFIKGTTGSARLGGCLWGYRGEGPHGTRDLLLKLGISTKLAEQVAFNTPRLHTIGEDWRLEIDWKLKTRTDTN